MINRIKDHVNNTMEISSRETWGMYKDKLKMRKAETRKMDKMTKNLLGTKPNGFTKVDQWVD